MNFISRVDLKYQRKLVTALKKIVSNNTLSDPFLNALKVWIKGSYSSGFSGNQKNLVSLYKSNPELFPTPVSVKSPLYRVMALWKEIYADIMSGHAIEPQYPLESWTSSVQAAKEHKEYLLQRDTWLIGVFKKKPKNALIYVPDYKEQLELGFVEDEKEYIVCSEPLTKQDLMLVIDAEDKVWFENKVTGTWKRKDSKLYRNTKNN